jgi:hypothetical protein
MPQFASPDAELRFQIGFCSKKLLEQNPKPSKPYDLPIEHASDMSIRLVFAILRYTSCTAVNGIVSASSY